MIRGLKPHSGNKPIEPIQQAANRGQGGPKEAGDLF